MAEKRQFIRHPTGVPIEFSVDPDALPSERGRGHDLGVGGLSFEADHCPEKGMILEIRIPLVDPVFETHGRVAWCRSRDGHYEIGVQFLDASDAFRARMVEQVCQIERYRSTQAEAGRELTWDAAAREWIAGHADRFPGAA